MFACCGSHKWRQTIARVMMRSEIQPRDQTTGAKWRRGNEISRQNSQCMRSIQPCIEVHAKGYRGWREKALRGLAWEPAKSSTAHKRLSQGYDTCSSACLLITPAPRCLLWCYVTAVRRVRQVYCDDSIVLGEKHVNMLHDELIVTCNMLTRLPDVVERPYISPLSFYHLYFVENIVEKQREEHENKGCLVRVLCLLATILHYGNADAEGWTHKETGGT